MQAAPISRQIWDMKYRLKTADGRPVDGSVEDTWRRVAQDLARPEREQALWEQRFYDLMADFRFLPAGRILSGAGSGRRVTLFNCFVMGDIPDDMGGIFQQLKEAAVTLQQGGGIGYDFSTLRPKGAPVEGVGADASGPVTFMDVWDSMCRTIMSAGSRRGAMMAVMRCDHPDIEDFIDAKQTPGRLRMFNLSVLATDAFMQAVKEDKAWPLQFGGVTLKTVPARVLWDKIMRATYSYAEPGVIFIDRINRLNNLYYCENIHGTNPCVTTDTWVQTGAGARQVAELIGVPFTALADGKAWLSGPEGFFKTGTKPVLRLTTTCGRTLTLTADHLVRYVTKKTRWTLKKSWIEAGKLVAGDEIVIHDQRGSRWTGNAPAEQGYLLGLLVGDGVVKADKTLLSVWLSERSADGATASNAVMRRAEKALRTMPHRVDFAGWMKVQGRTELRCGTGALTELAKRFGIVPGHKTITPEIEREGSAFTAAFLCGLFDTDGTVIGTQEKGVSVRLAQSNLTLLQAAQRMLGRLGINSTIYQDRRDAGFTILPDGKGGNTSFKTKAQHELVVSGENILTFADVIGFEDTDKVARLANLLGGYRRAMNRERFTVTVASIEPVGVADVYDVRVPGVNAFDANGFYVHNCGEQPLPPYGNCLLGSINLARLVVAPFTPDARLDQDQLTVIAGTAVRLMDNVIEVSRYPLPEHEHEAKAKRRIGLGVTGLADALIMCDARYGGGNAVRLCESWMKTIKRAAYLASADLAAEKGVFPLFDRECYLAGEHVSGLDEDIRAAIGKHGIRNALITSIAPTGTISLFAGNVSSGIEPVFSFRYTRQVLMPDGTRREEEVSDYAYRQFRRLRGDAAPLPDSFVDAQGLTPHDHLVMQATVQKFIDSSISKTINCPESIRFEDFKDIYLQAYDLGCKGCTTYRPNDVTGAVLEVRKETLVTQPELPLDVPRMPVKPRDLGDSGAIVQMFRPLDRPEALPGKTYKVRWPDSDHATYITVNDVVQEGRRRPFEVFINSKNMEHYAWTVALTRMISAVFRRGGDVSFVVEELKAVFDPRGGQWMGGRYVPSLLAAIGEVIERHMIDIGFLPAPCREYSNDADKSRAVGDGVAGEAPEQGQDLRFRHCPKCGAPSLLRQEDCDTCTSCGYSKCS